MPATAGCPTPLFAVHSIFPAMLRFRTSTIRRRLFSKILLFGKPLCCQLIIGCGIPFASHTISNTEPNFTSNLPLGFDITLGGSDKIMKIRFELFC